MRLNKKRLAALAMSAVMAASAVPFPVYAEELSAGEDVVVSAETTVETPEVGKTSAVFEKFTVNYVDGNFEVTANYDNGTSEPATGAVTTVVSETKADCTNPGSAIVSVEWKGIKQDNIKVTTDAAIGHKWGEKTYEKYTVVPTCQTNGTKVTYQKCEHDETHENIVKTETVNASPEYHDLDESKTQFNETSGYKNIKMKDGKFVLDADGNPQLDDVTKSGSYTVQMWCKTEKAFVDAKVVEIAAQGYASAEVVKTEGIATSLDELNTLLAKLPVGQTIDEKLIEMKDCDTAGSYTIQYKDTDGKVVAKESVKVAAHHKVARKVAVFESKKDAEGTTVTYDSETGELTVKSNSCTTPIKYTEVTECGAAGCKASKVTTKFAKKSDSASTISEGDVINHASAKEEKVAEVAGKHTINTTLKNRIEAAVKNAKVLTIDVIENAIGSDEEDVKLDVPENVCENGGEITVNYICTQDGETVVESAKYTVVVSGHKEDVPVVENKVAATCEKIGSYDEVTYCKRCNKELSRVTKVIPRLKHTNETSVGANGVGANDYLTDKDAELKFVGDVVVKPDNKEYKAGVVIDTKYNNQSFAGYSTEKVNLGVYSEVFTKCQECGNNEVRLADYLQRDNVKVTIKEVQNDKNGSAGYIVLEAVYTKANAGADNGKTVTLTSAKIPYYSSIEAYNGRVEPESKNGLYKDEDGKYRYYVDGVLQKDFTGILDYAGNKFLIVSGELANDVNGLWYSEADKTWYFLVEGGVRTDYTGTVLYDGEWFYVSNGRLNEAVNGLVAYNGGTFLFIEGRLRTDVSGLWQDINNPDDWYFLALGQVQTQYSGVAMYDGGFFVVENGKFDKDYNGTIKYDGKTFKVVGGQLVIK